MSGAKHCLFWLVGTALSGVLMLGVACGDDDDDSAAAAAPIDDDDDDNDDDDNDDDNDDHEPACSEGERRCSADILEVLECRDGAWVTVAACLRDEGRVCQDAVCIDPWRYDSPQFDPCDDEPHATEMTLAQKAVKYDRLARVLHVHPADKRIHNVTLAQGVTEETGDYQDVVDWHPGENDGLWTGLYIASQAFRYGATGDAEALDNLRVMMDGLETGMRITGVDGLFTREYITPGVTGMACPTDPASYIPDEAKDDNRWVKVDADGAILVYDPEAVDFVRTEHFVPAEYTGYCWLDNVSQDEYAGHMLALGSVYQLVDDAQLRERAAVLLEDVAAHLMLHDMALVDWDGREVEHGRFWPLALTDFPGFNVIMGLNMVLQGAVASDRADLWDFYENCLLQENGPNDCLDRYLTPPQSFMEWLWLTGMYVGRDGCKSNWNNMAMAFCQIFTLIWFERQPWRRAQFQDALESRLYTFRDNVREMARQDNAAWTVIYASMKRVGPGSTGQDVAAVNEAICAMRRFPESESLPALEVGEELFPTDWDCESRFDGEYLTFDPVPEYLRCPVTFAWWSNPYQHQSCQADARTIKQPADYLLPYWMGRYFGYLDEAW